MQNGVIVSRDVPQVCPYCSSEELIQDEDVLDTWFSSALWPFSTLGWPDNTDDLKIFYPTSVLVTGFDIIFFWVARMIMMGLKFMGDVPFRDVYIHALIRDLKGHKMSKSKGNVVDPLIMIDRYGTDAFRFTLAAFAAQGRDIKFSEERVEGYRHFVNKLWNAARFIMMNTNPPLPPFSKGGIKDSAPDLASKWILSRLAAIADDINRALEEYRFNDAASSIYQFIWHEFCDWYLEMTKSELNPPTPPSPSRGEGEGGGEISELQTPSSKAGVRWCLLHTLDTSLRLLHPFMPFVTEEIWQTIPHVKSHLPETEEVRPQIGNESGIKESIMVSDYPKSLPRDYQAEEDMSYIIEAVMGIRTIRGELNISPSFKLKVMIKTFTQMAEKILKGNMQYLKNLAKASEINIGINVEKPEYSATSVKSFMEIYVPLKGVLNIAAEIDRLKKEEAKVEGSIASLNKKLFNEDFLQRAPKEIVDKEKAKYEELIIIKRRIMESIKMLEDVEVRNDS